MITGEAAHGYSSGQAMSKMEQLVKETLGDKVEVEWSGLSYQEKNEDGNTGLVLLLAFVFVFLFLAALYESWTVPLAVILSLPVAGIGAYLGIWLTGLENNIYFQIGLVMLVGLVAKNAILIVEFAKESIKVTSITSSFFVPPTTLNITNIMTASRPITASGN